MGLRGACAPLRRLTGRTHRLSTRGRGQPLESCKPDERPRHEAGESAVNTVYVPPRGPREAPYQLPHADRVCRRRPR
eukprot:5041382-Prymnesium_polylepis.1